MASHTPSGRSRPIGQLQLLPRRRRARPRGLDACSCAVSGSTTPCPRPAPAAQTCLLLCLNCCVVCRVPAARALVVLPRGSACSAGARARASSAGSDAHVAPR
eukprot:15430629-Alexandrium_andersonii.AAC.1